MDLEFSETANGPCISCENESQGSPYWLPMSEAHWDIIRPYVEEMTPASPHSGVMNTLFWSQLCKPFCSPECVQEYHK